jgi:hypothetical protein
VQVDALVDDRIGWRLIIPFTGRFDGRFIGRLIPTFSGRLICIPLEIQLKSDSPVQWQI